MYKLEGNDKLDEMLQTILNDTEARRALAKELGMGDAAAGA